MSTPSYDWSQFVVRINLNASKENLYKAWATRAGIEEWFLRRSEFRSKEGKLRMDDEPVQVGDTYKWLWFGYPDEVVENGEILDLNGKDYFKFRFGKAGDCSVKIKEEEGEMIVELTQENIPTDEFAKHNFHVGCKTGWTFYFSNLKSMMEGGIDLRNKNEKIQNVVSA
jgi:uncharacterized protein YndB with AHSA1/START domain